MTAYRFWEIAYYVVLIGIGATCMWGGLWVVYNELREWSADRKKR
jgi:hypothetical protein